MMKNEYDFAHGVRGRFLRLEAQAAAIAWFKNVPHGARIAAVRSIDGVLVPIFADADRRTPLPVYAGHELLGGRLRTLVPPWLSAATRPATVSSPAGTFSSSHDAGDEDQER